MVTSLTPSSLKRANTKFPLTIMYSGVHYRYKPIICLRLLFTIELEDHHYLLEVQCHY